MTTKEYLRQAYKLDLLINSKLAQIDSLRNLASKTTSTLSAMPMGGKSGQGKAETCITRIFDLEREITADIDRLVDLKKEMFDVIMSIGEPSYRLILEMRYQNGWEWQDIARLMHYSIRQVHNLHGYALQAVSNNIIWRCDNYGA